MSALVVACARSWVGASGWGDYVIADPARAAAINGGSGVILGEVLYEAVGVRTVGRGVWVAAREATADDLRAAYRRVLLHLAADDLTSGTPEDIMPSVGARIADLVDATLDAGRGPGPP